MIVFLTLFLGLASGKQPLVLEVAGPVSSVRVLLGGREIAAMTRPPWSTIIDLGADLTPRELTAIAFDAKGEEIARASQVINLPRPTAEFDIVIEGDEVSLRWHHLMSQSPDDATMTLDEKPLPLDVNFHAELPKIDRQKPHVIAAEMRFPDGFVARRELVLESTRSASTESQLTPVLLRTTGAPRPKTWDGCITRADGTPVRIAAVENPPALAIAVRDPFPVHSPNPLEASLAAQRQHPNWSLRNAIALDRATFMRVMWAVAQHFSGRDATADLFEATVDFAGTKDGALSMLYAQYNGAATEVVPRQFADAVAVAGIRAATGSQRRAVIFVLSENADTSNNAPAVVRRYLESLGVPLFVWSPSGPRPELAASWGAVDDISKYAGLSAAVARVRKTLDEQRVAWVDVEPLEALRLKAGARCGIEMVARP
jgi:hypothetical protein